MRDIDVALSFSFVLQVAPAKPIIEEMHTDRKASDAYSPPSMAHPPDAAKIQVYSEYLLAVLNIIRIYSKGAHGEKQCGMDPVEVVVLRLATPHF